MCMIYGGSADLAAHFVKNSDRGMVVTGARAELEMYFIHRLPSDKWL